MRAGDKARVTALRLIDAEVLNYQIDNRVEITPADFILLLNRLRKQRSEAMEQYKGANRTDLYKQEAYEKKVIEEFLPEQLSDAEIESMITAVIANNAQDTRDMGKIMAVLKPRITGRADMGKVSGLVRQQLSKK